MKKTNVSSLIDFLIEKTTNNIIKWNKYNLRYKIEDIDADNSYFIHHKSGYIVLATIREIDFIDDINKENIYLMVQPDPSTPFYTLNDETSMLSKLTTLRLLAYKQNPNVEDFVDDFMSSFE